jgi:hypothetical protein
MGLTDILNKGPKPIVFHHVRRRDEAFWACEGCHKRYHFMSTWGSSSDPVATPVLSIEIPPWRATGRTLAQHEADIGDANRSGSWTGIGKEPLSCFVDFCSRCTLKGRDLKRQLDEEWRASQPKATFAPGLHQEAIVRHLEKRARMFATPAELSDLEWRCTACNKTVSLGATQTPELPALRVNLPPIVNEHGRTTAGEVVLALCQKCAPGVDATARAAWSAAKAASTNQTKGAVTT